MQIHEKILSAKINTFLDEKKNDLPELILCKSAKDAAYITNKTENECINGLQIVEFPRNFLREKRTTASCFVKVIVNIYLKHDMIIITHHGESTVIDWS